MRNMARLGSAVNSRPREAASCDKSVSRQYKVNAMPTTIIMDRDGKVRHVHFGYKAGYMDTYQAEVRTLLSERGK